MAEISGESNYGQADMHFFLFSYNLIFTQVCQIRNKHEIMDTSIMSFMWRPVLVILISAILSYLPHGSSEGWNSGIIRLSIMWLFTALMELRNQMQYLPQKLNTDSEDLLSDAICYYKDPNFDPRQRI